MDLLDFQQIASEQMADRVVDYLASPIRVGRKGSERQIPFLQMLNSITGSGKTLVLADAVSAVAQRLPVKPAVLWLSKATVVVSQSYANLAAGGAYHQLLDDFTVLTLADFDEADLASSSQSFLYFATVGTFNQEKKEAGTLNVFKSAIDDASRSTWESLKLRPGSNSLRRPLIVVYDEAHNLSDGQTKLLLELEPDAFLLSTATNRLPQTFDEEVIQHLRKIGGLNDGDLHTSVDATRVAASGLVKNQLDLVGRQADMEDVVSEMVASLKALTKSAATAGIAGAPKAVYVCKTNVAESTGERDTPKQPFSQRQAPPILIWRHLTERLKVKPEEIAVYCDLKVDKAFPLPDEFVLFTGGDKDYDSFVQGNFRHIIFNQSLQEGWDDPLVYLAYIDKSVGSKVQAEQVVGRLLRQPQRKHYANQRLNTAQIYVRVEATGVFDEVVRAVEDRIRLGKMGIRLMSTRPGKKARLEIPARRKATVPIAAIVTDRAEHRINQFLAQMTDFRSDDGTNTRGAGKRVTVQRIVGTDGARDFVWEDHGESAQVLARWLFSREVSRIHRGALGVAITSGAAGATTKFDARIGLGSPAASHITDVAKKVGDAFVDQVYLKLRGPNPYEVGPTYVSASSRLEFKSAIHEAYDADDFNDFEREFARDLDKKRLAWCRNPAQSGYSIPLPTPGKTLNFFPDFLVWKGKDVFAIDTKGSHLHADAARKLVSIKPSAGTSAPRVYVRFVSDGEVDEHGPKAERAGFTVWSFKPNGDPEFTHCPTISAAIDLCLIPDV